MTFRIREDGEEHIAGDRNCPGCQSPDGEHWPQLHRDQVSSCAGLVHVERFLWQVPVFFTTATAVDKTTQSERVRRKEKGPTHGRASCTHSRFKSYAVF